MKTLMVHPDLMDKLFRFFPEVCTIQSYTLQTDDYGETGESAKVWTDKFTDVDCTVATMNRVKNEDRKRNLTYVNETLNIILRGVYDVDEKDRVILNGINYNIMSVAEDSRTTFTRLIVEEVK